MLGAGGRGTEATVLLEECIRLDKNFGSSRIWSGEIYISIYQGFNKNIKKTDVRNLLQYILLL